MPTARRTLIFALLLVAAGSLIFTTGAAVVDGPADTFADDDLAVQPADGPNGNYAYLNDDDDGSWSTSPRRTPNLGPDFEGVNPRLALAAADGVFERSPTPPTSMRASGSTTRRERHVHRRRQVVRGAGQQRHARAERVGRGRALARRARRSRRDTVGRRRVLDPRGGRGARVGSIFIGFLDRRRRSDNNGHVPERRPPRVRRERHRPRRHGPVRGRRHAPRRRERHPRPARLSGRRPKRAHRGERGRESGALRERKRAGRTDDPRPIAYLGVEHDFDPDEVDAMTIRFSASRETLDDAGIDPKNVTLYRQTDAGNWAERVPASPTRTWSVFGGSPRTACTSARRPTGSRRSRSRSASPLRRDRDGSRHPGNRAGRGGDRPGDRGERGGAAGERTVTLTADGDPVANETVSLAPNETATVALSGVFETAGEYDLAVAGTDAGTLLVGDPAGDDGSADNAGTRAGTGSGTDEGAQTGDGAAGARRWTDRGAGRHRPRRAGRAARFRRSRRRRNRARSPDASIVTATAPTALNRWSETVGA